MKLSTDTAAFLETLLFVADSPDHEKRPFENSTIYDFHPEFIAGVYSFIDRFREYIAANHPDLDADAGKRSFGGNVFFSLSGHGCGFWDDRDREWGKAMQAAIWSFSDSLPGRGRYRFEELESTLSKHRGGKIDLAYLVKYLPERRREMFGESEESPWMECAKLAKRLTRRKHFHAQFLRAEKDAYGNPGALFSSTIRGNIWHCTLSELQSLTRKHSTI